MPLARSKHEPAHISPCSDEIRHKINHPALIHHSDARDASIINNGTRKKMYDSYLWFECLTNPSLQKPRPQNDEMEEIKYAIKC